MEEKREIIQKLSEQELRLLEIQSSVEKMRRYFLISMAITVATIFIPLIILIFLIPWMLKNLTAGLGI